MANFGAKDLIMQGEEGDSYIRINSTSRHNISIQAILEGDNITAAALLLEGSLDNIHYCELLTHILTAEDIAMGCSLFHIANKTVTTVKITIQTLTGDANARMSVFGVGMG